MAKIQLNGRKITVKTNLTIMDLLKKYNLNKKKIAIEYNGIILPKLKCKTKYLKNNDRLEIVHFIGGG